MKTIQFFLLLAILLGASGCISYTAVGKAKGRPNASLFQDVFDESNRTAPKSDPHPSYYALLPITVPLDAATLPFQAITLALGAFYVEGWKNMH